MLVPSRKASVIPFNIEDSCSLIALLATAVQSFVVVVLRLSASLVENLPSAIKQSICLVIASSVFKSAFTRRSTSASARGSSRLNLISGLLISPLNPKTQFTGVFVCPRPLESVSSKSAILAVSEQTACKPCRVAFIGLPRKAILPPSLSTKRLRANCWSVKTYSPSCTEAVPYTSAAPLLGTIIWIAPSPRPLSKLLASSPKRIPMRASGVTFSFSLRSISVLSASACLFVLSSDDLSKVSRKEVKCIKRSSLPAESLSKSRRTSVPFSLVRFTSIKRCWSVPFIRAVPLA